MSPLTISTNQSYDHRSACEVVAKPPDQGELFEVPDMFFLHRGWSQELNMHHIMFPEDAGKRFEVRGRFTPLDLDHHPKCVGFGATPDEAKRNFLKRFQEADYGAFYQGAGMRITELEAQLTAATSASPSGAPSSAVTPEARPATQDPSPQPSGSSSERREYQGGFPRKPQGAGE